MTRHIIVDATRLSLSPHPYSENAWIQNFCFHTLSSQLAYKLSVVSIGLKMPGIQHGENLFHFYILFYLITFTHVRVPQNIIRTYQYICRVTNLACICTPLWAENYICMEIHDFICIGESNSTNHGSSFTNTISFFFFFFHISSAVFVHEIRLSFSFHSSQHSTAMYK